MRRRGSTGSWTRPPPFPEGSNGRRAIIRWHGGRPGRSAPGSGHCASAQQPLVQGGHSLPPKTHPRPIKNRGIPPHLIIYKLRHNLLEPCLSKHNYEGNPSHLSLHASSVRKFYKKIRHKLIIDHPIRVLAHPAHKHYGGVHSPFPGIRIRTRYTQVLIFNSGLGDRLFSKTTASLPTISRHRSTTLASARLSAHDSTR